MPEKARTAARHRTRRPGHPLALASGTCHRTIAVVDPYLAGHLFSLGGVLLAVSRDGDAQPGIVYTFGDRRRALERIAEAFEREAALAAGYLPAIAIGDLATAARQVAGLEGLRAYQRPTAAPILGRRYTTALQGSTIRIVAIVTGGARWLRALLEIETASPVPCWAPPSEWALQAPVILATGEAQGGSPTAPARGDPGEGTDHA